MGKATFLGKATGFNREIITQDFLNKHLPRRLKPILGGTIFGNNSKDSKQIDIICSNDISINFEDNAKMFVAIENVASAISVKSVLNKEAIFDTLQNLSSIPQIDTNILSFKILKPGAIDSFIDNQPSLFVYAFKGVKMEKALEHINEFYSKNPQIPLNRYPQGIIVNNQYYIKFARESYNTSTGYQVPAKTFYGMKLDEIMIGYPYIQLLNSITSYVDWLPFMRIDLHHYFNSSFGI
ncbi:DUF6602 domain-containing protein [uncultured Salegentibacter sp.]|uniref:DUF6602 domain-containing protein n=1 Tax=uncultured Salegentibacter sp. TaxID=259320 RepID=UPI002596C5FC|nr:DUF6602 domain-containing protein [uncultured Salegentibacter sp.]